MTRNMLATRVCTTICDNTSNRITVFTGIGTRRATLFHESSTLPDAVPDLMRPRNMNPRYTRIAIFLHWLVALGLIGTFSVGFYMEGLPLSPNKLKLYSWHKWAGITLLAIIVIRLAWRLANRPPAFPDTMGPSARLAAHAGHWLLYALMLLIPFSGWLMSSAQGFPVVWFGVLPLPDLVPKNSELGELLKKVHAFLNYTLLIAVTGHIALALHHHFVRKDGTLTRMLPGSGQ